MNENNYKTILSAILDCGTDDIEVLGNIEYDLYDIITEAKFNGDLTLAGIYRETFYKGISELEECVKDRIEEYKYDLKHTSPEEGEYSTLNEAINILSELDPWYEINVEYYGGRKFYGLLKNLNIYKEYFSNEIEAIENKMGFEFQECY